MRIIIEDDYRSAVAPVVTMPGQQVQSVPSGAGFAGVPTAATPGVPAVASTLIVQNAGEPAAHVRQLIAAHATSGAGTRVGSIATGIPTPSETIDIGPAPEWLKRANLLSTPTSTTVS